MNFDPTEARGYFLNIGHGQTVEDAVAALNEQGHHIVPDEYWHKTLITTTDKLVTWEYVPDGCFPRMPPIYPLGNPYITVEFMQSRGFLL